MRAIVNQDQIIPLAVSENQEISFKKEGDLISLRYQGINYQGRVIKADPRNRIYQIELNKKIFTVQLETDLEERLQSIQMMQKPKNQVKEIKSPMPGLVLKLLKSPGEPVQKGETLLILEAMKMENLIKSPVDGIIKSIDVNTGEPVDKGQSLLTFE